LERFSQLKDLLQTPSESRTENAFEEKTWKMTVRAITPVTGYLKIILVDVRFRSGSRG
jgi:hypothetical protein